MQFRCIPKCQHNNNPEINQAARLPKALNCLLRFVFQKATSVVMQGSYHVGNTASRPISEVKQRWALLVLAWETSLEPRVTLRFCFVCMTSDLASTASSSFSRERIDANSTPLTDFLSEVPCRCILIRSGFEHPFRYYYKTN